MLPAHFGFPTLRTLQGPVMALPMFRLCLPTSKQLRQPLTEHPDGRPLTKSHPGPGNATLCQVTIKMKVHTGMLLPSLTPLRDPTLSLKVFTDRACQNSQRDLQAAGPLRCVVSGPIDQPLGIETVRLT